MYNVSIYVIDNVLFTYEFSYKLHLFSYYYINNAMQSPLKGHLYVKKGDVAKMSKKWLFKFIDLRSLKINKICFISF